MDSWQDAIRPIPHLNTRWHGDYFRACCDAIGLEPRSIVEIGVYRGKTSASLRKQFPEAKLYLVDPWRDMSLPYRLYDNTRGHWDALYERVAHTFRDDPLTEIIRSVSGVAAGLVPDDIDLVFIDGDHQYEAVCTDINLWRPKLSPRALLAGHDYRHHGVYKQVKQAVHDTLGHEGVLEGKGRVWFWRAGDEV